MRISAVTIMNFKRIEDVRITPDADRTIILLGGKNRQGKSSTLDALTAAFGGKKTLPADPVRHGAGEAEIRVELDGGELTVRRVIQPDGESVLEVRDRLGAVKSPQAALDKLIGARFLDPLQFLSMPAKEQRAQLMRLIDGADRIADLDEKRARAFTKRTEVGRDLTKAEGELARLPEVEVGEAIDVAELGAEARRLAEIQRAGDGLGHAYKQAQRETEAARREVDTTIRQLAEVEAQIAKLQSEAARLRTRQAEWAEDVDKCERNEAEAKSKLDAAAAEWASLAPRRSEIDEQIARAGEHNRKVGAAEMQNARHAEAKEAVAKLTKERDDITKVIATIDDRKAKILAAAKLPVDGLSVDEEGVTLDGVPLAQASGAERYRVALALAIAASPGLDDVWIRDGALFDEEHLALVAEHAAAAGKRVWVERVGTTDPGVIVIADGKVAS